MDDRRASDGPTDQRQLSSLLTSRNAAEWVE
jgi:hypothetical protein